MYISSWVYGWSENAHMHYLLCSWNFWQSWKIAYQETVPAQHCWWSERNHKNYYIGWKSAAQHMQTCQYIHTGLYLTLRYAVFYYRNLSANFLLPSPPACPHTAWPHAGLSKSLVKESKHWFHVDEYMIPSQNQFALHSTSVLHCESLNVPVNNGLSSHSLFYAGSAHISAEGITGFPGWGGRGAVSSAPKMYMSVPDVRWRSLCWIFP